MYVLDTSAHSREESVRILSREIRKNPLLILTGPQGGGKTTLAIQLISEKIGAMLEGRARSAQPVVLVRRDLAERMKGEIVEKRKLPIMDGDNPIYVSVTMYDKLKNLIEYVFDVMELGEPELIRNISELTRGIGIVPKVIEVIAQDDDLVKRRLSRHLDAKDRLEALLEKEKKYGIETNILGIQGARIDLKRQGVEKYAEDQISRTIEDFDRVIPTSSLSVKDCIEKMVEISRDEGKESGFLVLHTSEGERIISDLVVGRKKNSLVGVTLLEIYVGFRQNRALYRAYKHCLEGKLEVIHSYTPSLQELEYMANPWTPPLDNPIISTADIAASERFDIIVSVISPNREVESSNKKRKKELLELLGNQQDEY